MENNVNALAMLLYEALKKVEWVATRPGVHACPRCHALKKEGHMADCPVYEALNEAKKVDQFRGLDRTKFKVIRCDGSTEPGGKHHNCIFYVLDLDHDKFSVPAMNAYATACREEYPLLADDILSDLRRMEGVK